MKFKLGTFLFAGIIMFLGVHLIHQTLNYETIIGIWLIAFATSQRFWEEKDE